MSPLPTLKTRIDRLSPLLLATALFLVPEVASANILDNFGTAILDILNNGFLRSIAIVAVIVVGLFGFTGRLPWSVAGFVLLGIVITFGSAGIVDFIIAESATA